MLRLVSLKIECPESACAELDKTWMLMSTPPHIDHRQFIQVSKTELPLSELKVKRAVRIQELIS